MVLCCQQVSKSFRQGRRSIPVIESLDLTIAEKECVVIRGASGAGKTTLLLTLGAMMKPDEGVVQLGERDIYQLSEAQRAQVRNQTIGFVFQTFHLIPYLTVLQNVSLAVAESSQAAAREVIDRLGLTHRIDHLPRSLSAGEQQRTAIARATVNGPQIILADEPTGNLDEENSQAVYAALDDVRQAGSSLVIVTHGSAALSIADRVLTLDAGRLTEA